MKKSKRKSILVLLSFIIFTLVIGNIGIQNLAYENVVYSADYKDSNSQNTLNYYVEEQYFPGIVDNYGSEVISRSSAVNFPYGPFSYQNTDYFSGKKLTKIGIPVKTVAAVDGNQTFTLYVVDKAKLAAKQTTTYNRKYELKLPQDQLGSSTTVNKWIYVDLTKYDISLSDNETLAFSAATDTVNWAYIKEGSGVSPDSKYIFSVKVLSAFGNAASTENILFDIYVEKEETYEITSDISNKLKNLNISILGDSISTYKGYSNDAANTNSTIGNNAIFYKGTNGITNVNDTWWMQSVNITGMNLLVNNSYSGDTVANSHSTRALQLHDNTGENAGTNPDVIAVYFGINDIKNGANVSTFKNNYTTMVNNIKNKYGNAKIFLFTHVPYYYPNATVPTLNASSLEEFNNVIRDIANENEQCYLVDLFANSGISYDNLNYYMYDVGLHPSTVGMDMITKTFLESLNTVYSSETDNVTGDQNQEDTIITDNNDEVENPYTSTSLIKIISLILIVGSIIVLINTFKNTKVNKYE